MITVQFDDGSSQSFPKGSSCYDIAKVRYASAVDRIVAVKANGMLCDWATVLEGDTTLNFLTFEDQEGGHVFWHSSAHLLAAACFKLYPNIQLGIGPAIEQGFYYDIDFGSYDVKQLDLARIEKTMLELAGRKDSFYRRSISRQDAIELFRAKGQYYKLEILDHIPDQDEITIYQQGDFFDLCRGPHLSHTGLVGAVKILNVAGAYWKGNEKNKQLTRIYAISFPNQADLDLFLRNREEAKQYNHQVLNKSLNLFTISHKVGLGLPMWLPNGAILRERLIDFLRKEQYKRGYKPVVTPHIGHKSLYITSGHYEKYREDCFNAIETGQDGESYLLKPMNCPHHCEIYNYTLRSYKDLPLRMAEFGTICRYELHGALQGLVRTRCFTQDDAHIFCTQDGIVEEITQVIDLILYVLKSFNFTDYTARLSFRDPKSNQYIGAVEDWDRAEQALTEITTSMGLKTVYVLGEAAFYGPKVDFIVKDTWGRPWQIGTVQLDYQLPIRFDLWYIGPDGKQHRPVMIHRASFGSLERFIALLTEHTKGNYPVWLAPEQVVILPLSDHYIDYANRFYNLLVDRNITAYIDDRSETISKKIREAELRKVPYIAVLGQKEMDSSAVAMRKRSNKKQYSLPMERFVDLLLQEIIEHRDDIL